MMLETNSFRCIQEYRYFKYESLRRYTRLMSWDLAINEDAEPVLIETNLTFSGVDVHQLANGPIYGNHPEPIIEEVVNNSYTLRKLLRL